MTQYCCYFLDDGLCVVDYRRITCEADATVGILANDLRAENVYSAIEVWDSQRQGTRSEEAPAGLIFCKVDFIGPNLRGAAVAETV
jgi:hypothetical protein